MPGGNGAFSGLNRTAVAIFGVQCELLSEEGEPVPFRAIFDRDHTLVEVGGEVPLSSTGPMLGVILAELSFAPDQGMQVSVPDEGVFEIDDIQKDSEGMAVLPLLSVDA